MHVRRLHAHGLGDQTVDQADDRSAGGIVQQVFGLGDLVNQVRKRLAPCRLLQLGLIESGIGVKVPQELVILNRPHLADGVVAANDPIHLEESPPIGTRPHHIPRCFAGYEGDARLARKRIAYRGQGNGGQCLGHDQSSASGVRVEVASIMLIRASRLLAPSGCERRCSRVM